MLAIALSVIGTNLVVAYFCYKFGKSAGFADGYTTGVINTAIQAAREIGQMCDMCSESTKNEFLEKMGEWRKAKETK